MLMVISPAKTLDYQTPPNITQYSQPEHLAHAQQLIDRLQTLDPPQVAELMGLSDKLAALNVARYTSWRPNFTPDNAKQALLAFKGDVYTALQAETFTPAQWTFAQQHLRILSGLYGVLRPLDLMQPYRLEMGTRLANQHGKDLYAFWGQQISGWLNQALAQQGDDILLNLASNEYFRAVHQPSVAAQIINTEFRDLKDGRYKIISIYAKQARGLMARYVIQEAITAPEQLKDFDYGGYRYSDSHSTAQRLVFLRDTP